MEHPEVIAALRRLHEIASSPTNQVLTAQSKRKVARFTNEEVLDRLQTEPMFGSIRFNTQHELNVRVLPAIEAKKASEVGDSEALAELAEIRTALRDYATP